MTTALHRSHAHKSLVTILVPAVAVALGPAAPAAALVLIVNGDAVPLNPPPLVEAGDVLLPASVLSHGLGIAVMPTEPQGMWVVGSYATKIYIRADTTRYMGPEGEALATHPPRMQGGEMHVPLSTLERHFDLDIQRPSADQIEIKGVGAEVLELRQGSHPDYARVVIDVSVPAPFRWRQDPNTLTVTIPGVEGQTTQTLRAFTYPEELVPEILQEPTPEGGTHVIIGHRCPTDALVFTLTDPSRIVIDFPRAKPEIPGPPPAPEQLAYRRQTAWQVHRIATSRGLAIAYSLLLPAGEGGVKLRPALANDTVQGKATVGQIARRFGAYAAVNGGFFAPNGSPLGMLVIDGQWIKEPILGRTVLGIMQDGSLQMGNVQFAGAITLPGAGTFRIDTLNAGHSKDDEVVLYTGHWGHATPEKEKTKATRVMLAGSGQVLRVNAEGRAMVIPQGGYVLSVVGPRAAKVAQTQAGVIAAVQLATNPQWPGLRHAIGGGPRLVANGRPYVTATTERFRPDVAVGAAPRSAIGILANGDVFFVVADGRQAGYSSGMSLGEMATFLVKQGVRDAMNLDGGGSSTLVVNGMLANRPCDGCERRVSNALLAFHVAPPQVAGQ